jgi:hypothetical protein
MTELVYTRDWGCFFGESKRAKVAFGTLAISDSKVLKLKQWANENLLINEDGELKDGFEWATRSDGSRLALCPRFGEKDEEDGTTTYSKDAIEKSRKEIIDLCLVKFLSEPFYDKHHPLRMLDKLHTIVCNNNLGAGLMNQLSNGYIDSEQCFWQLCMSCQVYRNSRMQIVNLLMSHLVLLGFRSEEIPPMDNLDSSGFSD